MGPASGGARRGEGTSGTVPSLTERGLNATFKRKTSKVKNLGSKAARPKIQADEMSDKNV